MPVVLLLFLVAVGGHDQDIIIEYTEGPLLVRHIISRANSTALITSERTVGYHNETRQHVRPYPFGFPIQTNESQIDCRLFNDGVPACSQGGRKSTYSHSIRPTNGVDDRHAIQQLLDDVARKVASNAIDHLSGDTDWSVNECGQGPDYQSCPFGRFVFGPDIHAPSQLHTRPLAIRVMSPGLDLFWDLAKCDEFDGMCVATDFHRLTWWLYEFDLQDPFTWVST